MLSNINVALWVRHILYFHFKNGKMDAEKASDLSKVIQQISIEMSSYTYGSVSQRADWCQHSL